MISFAVTEDQELVRETVRKFAADEIRPRLRELERDGVPGDLRDRFAALGLSLVDVPEAMGGLGLDAFTACLVHEELAFGDPGAAVALWGPGFVPEAVMELAAPGQGARILAPFAGPAGARRRGAVAWSEPGKGSETGFATRARRDGDGWIVDGDKVHVVNGDGADTLIVFAQVDGAGDGWGGVGAFLVDGAAPGPRAAWLGLETVPVAPVAVRGCRAERLAGAADVVVALRRMFARIALVTAARQIGLARASYEHALAYTQDRVAFGKPVAHFQAIAFTLAEMHMDVESARWMLWRAAAELDAGSAGALATVARAAVHANDAAWRVADNGVQLLGGAGFIQDFPAEKWLRDTKALALMGMTSEGHRLSVAAAAVGQPDAFGPGLPSPWIQPVVT
jgi:alkylation response protein AidB-like acyl-CoA dehydrogenase